MDTTPAQRPDHNERVLLRAQRRRETGLGHLRNLAGTVEPDLLQSAIEFVTELPHGGTAGVYAHAIGRWFAWCSLHRVSPRAARQTAARDWINSERISPHARGSRRKSRSIAPKTRANWVAGVRAWYRSADPKLGILQNPFEGVFPDATVVDETPALSQEQFEAVLVRIRTHPDDSRSDIHAARDYSATYLLGRIGIRECETIGLTIADFRSMEARGLITVLSKGGQPETIGVPRDAVDVVSSYVRLLQSSAGRALKSEEALFPPLRGHVSRIAWLSAMDASTFYRIIRRRFANAELSGPRFGPHVLRATAATIAWEHGAALAWIKEMLRHRWMDTTLIYIKRLEKQKASAARTWRPSFSSDTTPLVEPRYQDREGWLPDPVRS